MERRRVTPHERSRRAAKLDLDDVIYGLHAVEEAMVAGEVLRKIHIGDERKRDPALRRLLALATEAGITVRFEGRAFFAQFPYRAHQNVIAFGSPFGYISLDEAVAIRPEAKKRLIVVMDHITDPYNCGAITRSAECAGADVIVLPERRSAGINATVRKASAGATAHIPVARVANIAGALRAFKKAGCWIAGAAGDTDAVPYYKADFRDDLVIVIGAEGEGLAPIVRKECDFMLRIPMFGKIESLNASVAAGILLFEAARQRFSP